MLTRSSVHWAARIVATRSSSGFEKSRAIVASGYAFLSARTIFRARARFACSDSRIELSRQGPAAMRMASGVISTRPTSSRTGSRLASPSEGSYPRTTQSTSEPGSGTPPTRTRSNATAKGRSRDGTRRTRAVTSGPGCAAASTSAPGSNVTDARLKPLSCRRNSLKSAARIVARSSRTRPASSGLSRPSAYALNGFTSRSSTPSWRSRTRASAAFRRVRSPTVARPARSRPPLPRAPGLEPKAVGERVVAEVARREEVVVRHDADGGGRTAAVEGEEGEDLAVAPVAAHRGRLHHEGHVEQGNRDVRDAEHRRAHLDHPGDDQQHAAAVPQARRERAEAQAREDSEIGRAHV